MTGGTNSNDERGGGKMLRNRRGRSTKAPDLNLSSLSTNDIPVSPEMNRYHLLSGDDIPCEVCNVTKTDNVEMLQLNCKRCKKMFCTTCVNVPFADFNVLSRIDSMWCCPECRPKAEKAFEVDVKVEDFKKYVSELEARIISLEGERAKINDNEQHIKSLIKEEMKNSSSSIPTPGQVKKLITDEVQKQREEQPAVQPEVPNMREIIQEQIDEQMAERERQPRNASTQSATAQDVITELLEQRKRQANIILYRVDELHTADEEGRTDHDIRSVLELVNYLKDDDEEEFIEDHFDNIQRLGSYDQDRSRPLLVEFTSYEEKKNIFNKLYKLKNAPSHMKEVSVCHDMTRSQREADKVLVERAKSLQAQCSENYIFRVRGPPWKRFIKKIPVNADRRNPRSPGNDMNQSDNQEPNQNQRRAHSSGDSPRMINRGAAAVAGR